MAALNGFRPFTRADLLKSQSLERNGLVGMNPWSAVGGGLDAVQLRVRTALGHQLIVRADLHEPGPIEHDDEIGHANRRETVGDEDRDATAIALASEIGRASGRDRGG